MGKYKNVGHDWRVAVLNKMPLVFKTLLILVSLPIAGGIWYGLIYLLIESRISALQSVAVWFSPWTYFGWILFLFLSFVVYDLLSSKLIPSKPEN
jgi:ABC-type Na+ efflux pump permease subunit